MSPNNSRIFFRTTVPKLTTLSNARFYATVVILDPSRVSKKREKYITAV
jgi:hypothetical protein